MIYWSIITVIYLLFIAAGISFLKNARRALNDRGSRLEADHQALLADNDRLKEKVGVLETQVSDHFFFYDLTRKIAPTLNKEELRTAFFEQLQYLGKAESLAKGAPQKKKDYFEFKLGDTKETLRVRTRSEKVIDYLPFFAKLLTLCMERINLYERLQQLSIYDPLTEVHNRRYFMLRYGEEFQRAKEFKLSLTFLMIDIDFFKKINDTYGHLVGDVVLKEVARLIQENVREIDFVGRYGGEEFSIILPETDKDRAITVGERIRSRISEGKVRAFDELLDTSISIGVASFPADTSYSDVLIEIADKALYKAKASGRDKICWF